MFRGVSEVMYFVADRWEAAVWYAQLFETEITVLDNPEHFFIAIGQQQIWFHQADAKVSSGTAGQVAYWLVDNFDIVLERAARLGAVLYRGPLDRLDGTYMCQVKDPFGNLIGLIGTKD